MVMKIAFLVKNKTTPRSPVPKVFPVNVVASTGFYPLSRSGGMKDISINRGPVPLANKAARYVPGGNAPI
jgi:hypothetical protein